jgi:hypothetical protein
MSRPRLPQETSDYIVDLLHDERETLRSCCLVSKSWVPRSRRHLFGMIRLVYPTEIQRWTEAFPDPAISPAYYTRSLLVNPALVLLAADAEGDGWILAFCNVVRLIITISTCHDMGNLRFRSLLASP